MKHRRRGRRVGGFAFRWFLGLLLGAVLGWILASLVTESVVWKALSAVAGAWLNRRLYNTFLLLYVFRREGRLLPRRTPREIRQFDQLLILSRGRLRYARDERESNERTMECRELVQRTARELALAGWSDGLREDIAYRAEFRGRGQTPSFAANWASVLDSAHVGIEEGEAAR